MPARRLTDAEIERIAEMREGGATYSAIAAAIGCSESTVYWKCLAAGAEPPNRRQIKSKVLGPLVVSRNGYPVRRYTDDEDRRLLALEAEGRSNAEIGRLTGRRPHTVKARLMTLARHEALAEMSA
ncbi:helix-turn-helix domain-containing protein [Methylobacterium sp. WL30]|uniref:helix-turn-helix domain-containing protein n=1 Tax=unclassified Methylobacterium TaxID=2615210 RepID=UPI0011CCC2CA|nr:MULTISPECIES: helix-turn-helix domain-containing protein [unclassified Methylobacterium]TXN38741.1 helix-turn-helix domain-containing protein [Methylobacterium sp. WL93]TXN52235.1 helix-turn-helix domain-containing protein [Methylobacterium sp. WL119]TXN70682.1 helix-turn-helix domain-containing protein [Methylobacterium sp. WL30]